MSKLLKFEFRITDESGDEVLGEDWCFFTMADFTDRGVEPIEIHVYSELRAIKRDTERKNWQAEMDAAYPEPEDA